MVLRLGEFGFGEGASVYGFRASEAWVRFQALPLRPQGLRGLEEWVTPNPNRFNGLGLRGLELVA